MSTRTDLVVQALVPARLPTPEALADALSSEKRLVDDLIAILRRQRTAVSADDRQGIDDTVFATHRVLATLGEARRRRRALNRMLGEREDISIDALDDVLGVRMTDSLRAARGELQGSARVLSREVVENRILLRERYSGMEA
jgi:hypothetical protein